MTGCSLPENVFVGEIVEIDIGFIFVEITESGNYKLQPTKYVLLEESDLPDKNFFIGDRIRVEFDADKDSLNQSFLGIVIEHPTKIK